LYYYSEGDKGVIRAVQEIDGDRPVIFSEMHPVSVDRE
jgi:hypothetical protein